jgi:hypothetical protein
LRRRTLPGLPERWDDPPLVDLRALAFARPHIARRARRHGGRCPLWPDDRANPARCRLAPSPANRETVPPAPMARLPESPTRSRATFRANPARSSGAVHADPVARVTRNNATEIFSPWSQLGCFLGLTNRLLHRPWPPANRRLGAVKRCFSARRSGCPVLVARKPWLLAPPGAACASWAGHVFLLGRPEGVLERLALSAPFGVRSPERGIPSRT